MENSFNNLGISAPILRALEDMGFQEPTEVQRRAIPHILNKEDLIAMSKTGSGKTAVFGVSILQMTDPESSDPQGLILEPTRELAVQVDNELKQMAKHLDHRMTAVYGQHNMNTELQALNNGVAIVTGTPGRVFDHISHGNIKTKNIRFLVLDEADRMLDMGFYDQVMKIIKTLPRDRITLLFSATIPAEIRRICSNHMKNPITIEIESETMTVDIIEQVYYRVDHREKNTQLNRLLLIEQPESCMIFCNTRLAVDRVQSFLTRKGYASQALHGDIPQSKRMKTMEQFKDKKFHLLVATDVAARGIDIDGLSLVINYDVPVEKDSYVHRIGRTGRAGNSGRAITLVTAEDIMSLYEIEEHIGAMIAEGELPTEAQYNDRKAEAEKWIEANSIKAGPPRSASASNVKSTQNRRQQGKTAQQSTSGQTRIQRNDRRNDQQGRQKSDQRARTTNTSEKTGIARTAPQNRPVRPPYTSTGTVQNRPPRTSSGAVQSRPQRAAQSRPAGREPYSERRKPVVQDTKLLTPQNQLPEPAARKNLFHRVIARILGKK